MTSNAGQGGERRFRIRAQWWGPDGKQCGVADDTFEGADAIEALDNAVPCSWRTGDFTHCTVKIEPLPDAPPSPTSNNDEDGRSNHADGIEPDVVEKVIEAE